jgi:hypothetical protein
MRYDAFISYSHASDSTVAPQLHSALTRFAKPWWRRRSLVIFRDTASLAANPGLWTSLQAAMDDSRYFVLLASPEAATSRGEWQSFLGAQDYRRTCAGWPDGS